MPWEERPICPDHVFIKQYGDQRTGTNYAKALLERNFPDVTVLMHVLGNKHAEPPGGWTLPEGNGGSDLNWICAMSSFDRSTAALSQDRQRYLEELARLATPVRQAVRNQQLRFLISIRHPLTWCISRLRHAGRSTFRPIEDLGEDAYSRAYVAAICARFNAKYQAWRELFERESGRVIVVRHEDWLGSPQDVLCRVQESFCLAAPSGWVLGIRGAVGAANWDGESARISGEPFTRLSLGELETAIPPGLWAEVYETIDWRLMQWYGYSETDVLPCQFARTAIATTSALAGPCRSPSFFPPC